MALGKEVELNSIDPNDSSIAKNSFEQGMTYRKSRRPDRKPVSRLVLGRGLSGILFGSKRLPTHKTRR